MKNLKKIFGLMAVLAISFFTTSVFTSCSSDDDDSNKVKVDFEFRLANANFTNTESNAVFNQFRKRNIRESWSETINKTDLSNRFKFWELTANVANAETQQLVWTGSGTAILNATYEGKTERIGSYNITPSGEDSAEKETIKYIFTGGSSTGTQDETNAIYDAFSKEKIPTSNETYPKNRVSSRIEYWKAKAALIDYNLQQKTWKTNYTFSFRYTLQSEDFKTEHNIGTYNFSAK